MNFFTLRARIPKHLILQTFESTQIVRPLRILNIFPKATFSIPNFVKPKHANYA